MLIIKAENIEKSFEDRLIIDAPKLEVHQYDRIGMVGDNGAGKTTLMKLLAGELATDKGIIRRYGETAHILQIGMPDWDLYDVCGDEGLISKYGVSELDVLTASGGEKTRLKIAAALSSNSHLILADEPTANLDASGIKMLEQQLASSKGAFVLISHDRKLLDALCNIIWEVENCKITVYSGNYSAYLRQKNEIKKRQELEYDEFIHERSRLTAVRNEKKKKAQDIAKKPKGMSYSEYNSKPWGSTRTFGSKQASIERAVKAVESRLEHLEIKEKQKEQKTIILNIPDRLKLYSRVVIRGEEITKSFDGKKIFDKADFQVWNGSRTALFGDNGSGKTTLFKMIMEKQPGIELSIKARVGYLEQELDRIDKDTTVYENAMKDSIYNASASRSLLAQMLFDESCLRKKVSVLSGGERIRLAFVRLLLSEFNVMLLDEPTNNLDIRSIEALETALKNYQGTLFFISHDRSFIKNVADNVLLIKNEKISAVEIDLL